MSSLSQAPRLEGLSPSHGAFQEHAAHPAKWSAELSSKGSWDACTSHGVSTFLHCAFTAHGLLEIAPAAGAIQLAPRATAGMTVGTDIAQPHPAPRGTGGMRAEVPRGVHLARAATRGDLAGWRTTGRLGDGLVGLRTGGTGGRAGEARKRLRVAGALARWRQRLGWPLIPSGTLVWPGIIQHDAEPEEPQEH